MGYSTPKKQFNLAEFLAEKPKGRSKRKNIWTRPTRSAPPAAAETADKPAADQADRAED